MIGEFLAAAYPWTKSLHVMSVLAWMAGLFYLPRLFVYHAEQVGQGNDTDHAEPEAKRVNAARDPRAHDQTDTNETGNETCNRQGSQSLTQQHPAGECDQQWHRGRDDGSDRSLNGLHRHKVQT